MTSSFDGRRIVIPNSELFTNSVVVNTAFDHRRLEYDIGIGYGHDIDTARRLILEAMNKIGIDPMLRQRLTAIRPALLRKSIDEIR